MAETNANPGPGYAKHPGYRLEFQPAPGRCEVRFAGRTVAASDQALVLKETAHADVVYFPKSDVDQTLLQATDHSSFCPFKGNAAYWSIVVGDRRTENAVWAYPAPYDEVPVLKDLMAFYTSRVDSLTVDGVGVAG